jgi:cell division protease FtsH
MTGGRLRRLGIRRGRDEEPPGWQVTPAPDGNGRPPGRRTLYQRYGRPLLVLSILLLVVNVVVAKRVADPAERVRVPYSPFFVEQVRDGNVAEISATGNTVQGEFERAVTYDGSEATTRFETEIPVFADEGRLEALLAEEEVVINAEPTERGISWWRALIFAFGPTIFIVLLLIFMLRRLGSGAGGISGLGRAKPRRYSPETQQPVTFADVAGIDEAKNELTEIVDFLRNPEKYHRLGGRIPRGVLLSGPPGTGKTLLARAVAGEAGVPFFSMSASEFVEMVVGVGASRVRSLFTQAKESAPAIIFIDELDAIGRARGSSGGFGGGNDEREQTLNQVLTEMDGFDPSSGVIVLGATNRPDILDTALLRPGRFDRRVSVQPPDQRGRLAILEVHTRSVPLADDVDLDALASTTPGMVGADLANIVNEAALLAAGRDHERVTMDDFSDAMEKIVLGAERKIVLSDEDRERTAYHEAGHAVVGMLTPRADPVRKVSIIPRGMALGVTFSAPDVDRFSYEQSYLLARIRVALGGRAAEELVFDEITTGAEADIQQLTALARRMVGRWGMSEAVGPIAVLPADAQSILLPGVDAASDETQRLVDQEVRRIVDEAYAEAIELLRDNRERLDALARALLEHETLDAEDAYAVAGVERTPREILEAGAP